MPPAPAYVTCLWITVVYLYTLVHLGHNKPFLRMDAAGTTNIPVIPLYVSKFTLK